MKYIYFLFFLFSLFFSNLDFLSANQKEWEQHSENITILDTEDVEKIINSRSTILIDVWKKDIKPEKLDSKKWMPAQRYSIPGAKWLPNVGLERLTPEIRMYFEESLETLTKGNKEAKILCFCRRGYYSKIAAERIIKMGYTNIYLYPGTDFWEDAGKRLVIVKPYK